MLMTIVETEITKLKRKIFWYEEHEIKQEELDKFKAANLKLVKDNENVKYVSLVSSFKTTLKCFYSIKWILSILF